MTQKQLGDLIGSSQASIQKIENGRSLRPRNIVTLAKVLRVSPAWLMFGPASIEEILEEALGAEALEIADAWSKPPEPQRSTIKQAILIMACQDHLSGPHTGAES